MIIGAGPTGLAAGNLLGAAGIATLIVECNTGLSKLPKAIALDDEGLRICQAMGLSAALSNCIVSDISIQCVAEGRLLAKIAPLGKRNGYPLISTFHQPEFEAVLLDGLRRFSCVNVCFQHTVEALEKGDGSDCVVVSVRTASGTLKQVRCSYLLACDGGRSIIRRSLNIPMRGTTFAQKWLVIDSISLDPRISLEHSPPVIDIFCNPHRPAVSIPAPHNGRRWEFMLLPGETEAGMLEPATISALLQRTDAFPHMHIIRKAIYTFHAAQAKSFSQGRVFLLGDAAHMMPPFGGQGLNSGLRDAHNLVWKVAMVLQGRASPQLLATYHKERSRHVAKMVAFASFLGAIFMSTKRPVALCRNLLIHVLYALPIVRKYLAEMRMKPQARYRAGFFLFNGPAKRMVGSLLPQSEVITQQGQRVLLDEVLGAGFAVLRQHSNPAAAFAPLQPDFWERLGTRFVCIQTSCRDKGGGRADVGALCLSPSSSAPPAGHSDPPQVCSPSTNQAEPHKPQPLPIVIRTMDKDFLRMCRDHFIVVRPDRFILGIFTEKNADSFVSAFQRLLDNSSL